MDALATLQAIEAIRQLKSRYFRLMDTRDFTGMGQVFCKNARFDCTEGFGTAPVGGTWRGQIGPIKEGRDVIMKWISESFARSTSAHHGHCHEVAIDGDTTAHGIVAMEDYIRTLDRQTELVHATGHYHETYRVEDGEWRIATTKLTRLFSDRQPKPDRAQIEELMAQYANALDAKDYHAIAACFASDASVAYASYSGALNGPSEISAHVKRALDPLDGTQHLFGNFIIDIEDDAARLRADIIAQHWRHGAPGGEHYQAGGKYEVEVRRIDGSWKFSRVHARTLWGTGNRGLLPTAE